MKKICIATPVDYSNYGNRLQNFAVHKICKKYQLEPITLAVEYAFIKKRIPKHAVLQALDRLHLLKFVSRFPKFKKISKSLAAFRFTQKHIQTKYITDPCQLDKELENATYFGIGGDQILAPYWKNIIEFATFHGMPSSRKICFAPSFGSDILPKEYEDQIRPELADISYPAVREESGCKLFQSITGNPAMRICDPVVMLTQAEWRICTKESTVQVAEPYLLLYFLGEQNEAYNKFIQRMANEKHCKIIDVSKSSKTKESTCDPLEFVSCIENAEMVLTDSFHAVMLTIIHNTPLVIFNRIGGEEMSTRITELVERYQLQKCVFEGLAGDVDNASVGRYDLNYVNGILDSERAAADEYYRNIIK